jgi:hypothetical protein
MPLAAGRARQLTRSEDSHLLERRPGRGVLHNQQELQHARSVIGSGPAAQPRGQRPRRSLHTTAGQDELGASTMSSKLTTTCQRVVVSLLLVGVQCVGRIGAGSGGPIRHQLKTGPGSTGVTSAGCCMPGMLMNDAKSCSRPTAPARGHRWDSFPPMVQFCSFILHLVGADLVSGGGRRRDQALERCSGRRPPR